MNCINKNTQEFKELLEASKLPSVLLAMRISKFQEQNGLESYPKLEDVVKPNELASTIQVKDGVQELFESNPELANIGTQEQYSQYLDTIFPDSKVKDIVYHYNSSRNNFEKFDKSFVGTQSLGSQDSEQGFSFVDNKLVTRAYGSFNTEIYSLPEEVWSTLDENTYKKYDTNIISALINPKQGDWKNTQNGWSEMMIKNPDNIHILGSKQDVEGFKSWAKMKLNNSSQQFQKAQESKDSTSPFEKMTYEDQVSFEKTIRDLSAKISNRISIPYKIDNRKDLLYKGKIEDGVAYINLAYATLDTPIHEILGHPIINAIKDKQLYKPQINTDVDTFFNLHGSEFDYEKRTNEYFKDGKEITKEEFEKAVEEVNNLNQQTSQLYQNLLKELETGKGKEVFDRIKRDYNLKTPAKNLGTVLNLTNRKETDREDYDYTEEKDEGGTYYRKTSKPIYYTLEEQQEEAIVELLGLMTAGKIEKGSLLELLKQLLREMKMFIRNLINQKEIEIDGLPDNMTVNDLANVLAYSNSKLILPGYEVEYTTPDNMKFKTYSEASNHVSKLFKESKDVDLSDVKLNIDDEIVESGGLESDFFELYDNLYSRGGLSEKESEYYLDLKNNNGRFYGSPKDYDSLKIAVSDSGNYYQLHPEDNSPSKITKERFEKYIQQVGNNLNSFIEKNKEYEQAKEIIEEWKRVNNIQYDPEEIYSRGQEFSSVVGAYSSFDVNLMMQNLLSHIEDNEKAGGKFAISAYTKPIDKQIGHLEGGGGKIKFKLYPQSNDILWAANTDVYSGSVWDASEKVNKDKKSELLGVSYTKYPSLSNVTTVQPNLADIVDNLAHHHNELGITLTGNNFRLEYDEDIPYTTKKIIDGINKILDQKYGKLVKPETKETRNFEGLNVSYKGDNSFKTVKSYESDIFRLYDISNGKETITGLKANEFDFIGKVTKGIQPTQTNGNLKESIEGVQNRVADIIEDTDGLGSYGYTVNGTRYVSSADGEFFKSTDSFKTRTDITEKEYKDNMPKSSVKEEEYTGQALINTKIAALKEIAKKYPRSLIRGEVKPMRGNSYSGTNYQLANKEENKKDNKVNEQKAPIKDTSFSSVISQAFANKYKKSSSLSEGLIAAQENRTHDSMDTTERKIEQLKSALNAEVIVDSSIPDSGQLLPANHALTKYYGKPVILINPEKLFSDTVIHEFGHLYIDLLGIDNPLVQEALNMLKGTDFYKNIAEDYPELSEEDLDKEVLATAIGLEGDKIFSRELVKLSMWQSIKNKILELLSKMFGIAPNSIERLATNILTNNTGLNGAEKFNTVIAQKSKYRTDKTKENKQLAAVEIFDKLTNDFSLHNDGIDRYYKDKEDGIYGSSVSDIVKSLKTHRRNNLKGDIDLKYVADQVNKGNVLNLLNQPVLPLAFAKALDDFFYNKLSTSGGFARNSADSGWADAFVRDVSNIDDPFKNATDADKLLSGSNLASMFAVGTFAEAVIENLDVIKERADSYQTRYNQAPIVGTSLHNAIESIIKGETSELPGNIDDVDNSFLNAVMSIYKKGMANGSVFRTEQILFSESRQVPGTADLIEITKDGEIIVYDYKTINALKDDKGPKSDYDLFVAKGYMDQLLSYGKMITDYGMVLSKNPYVIIMAEVNYSGVLNEDSPFRINEVRVKSLTDSNLSSHLRNKSEKIDRVFGSKTNLDQIDMKSEIQDLSDIVNKINKFVSIYKERTKNLKTSLNTKNIDKIEEDLRKNKEIQEDLKERSNRYVAKNNELIINSYINNIHEALAILESQKMTIESEITPEILQSLNYVLQATEVLYDLKRLLDEEQDLSVVDRLNLTKRLDKTIDFVDKNRIFYVDMVKKLSINTLAKNSNIMYGFYSETYQIAARKAGKTTKSEINQFVQDKLMENKEQIDIAEVRYWNKLYKDGFTDLRAMEYYMADPGISKSEFVQVVKNILDHADMEIRSKMMEVSPKINTWFESIGSPSGDPRKYWDFAVVKKTYIDPVTKEKVTVDSGRIMSEFTSTYAEIYMAAEDQIVADNKQLKKLMFISNKTKKDVENIEALKVKIKELRDERNNVLKKAKLKDENYDKPKPNPAFSKLSDKQKEQIRFIHRNLEEADSRLSTNPSKKLVRYVQGGVSFYNLPRMRMSNLESLKAGKTGSNFVSKLKDLRRPPSDAEENLEEFEIDNGEKFANTVLDSSGEEVFEIPVYFRNELENDSEQSYDIPTLLALNHETTIVYSENKIIEADLFVIKEGLNSKNNSKIFRPDSWSNKKVQDVTGGFLQKSDKNLVYQAVKSSIDNRLYKRRYMGTYSKGNYRLHTAMETLSSYSSVLSLTGGFMSALATFSQGSIYRLMEGIVGEDMTLADWKVGTTKAWADAPNLIADTQKYVHTSKTNLLSKKFGLESQVTALVNKFVQSNFAEKNIDKATLFSVTSIAEQMVTSTLMYSLLNNVKALNKDGKFIDKAGKVVSEENAMTLDEAYEVVDGNLVLNKHLVYTTKNVTQEYSKGNGQDTTIAATEISRYIRAVYADLYGQYNQDMKSVLQRNIFGKMAMSLRGWLPRGVAKRWRGITDAVSSDFMDFDQLRDEKNIGRRFYSQDKKSFQEGNYVTTIRFARSILREMKQGSLSMMAARDSVKGKMTTHELANLQRTMFELALMAAIWALGIMLRNMAKAAPDDEDKEKIYFAAYLASRINTELATFINPAEFISMMKNPAVGISTVERIGRFMNQLLFLSYNNEGELEFNILEEYESGAKEGENKALIKGLGLIPGQVKLEQVKSILGFESNNTIEDTFEAQLKN